MVGVWVLITIGMLCSFKWLILNIGAQETITLIAVLGVIMLIERISHRLYRLRRFQTAPNESEADDTGD
jgi:hypothetical protein